MRMRGWTIGLLAVAGLASGCPNCPPPPAMPGARLVGLSGTAAAAPLGTDAGWDVEALAYQGARLLVVTRDEGLERLDAAKGGRTRLTPKGEPDLDLESIDVVATGADGKAWLSDGSRIYTLGADDALTTFDDGVLPSPAPTPAPSATPTPAPSTKPGPPVFPPPDPNQLWGTDGLQALADDGAGGLWVARGEWIWHATPDGGRVRAVPVPRLVEDLVQWNGGLVVLLSRPRYDDADEDALLELMPGKPPAPWRHAVPGRKTVAIAAGPDGAVLVASEDDDATALRYRPGDVYDTRVERVGADGARKTLVTAEEAEGKPGGYQIMTSCAGPDYPDEFDVGALAAANDGRVAFVLARRSRLVVWRP